MNNMIAVERCGTYNTQFLSDKGIKKSKRRKTKVFEIEFIIEADGKGYINNDVFELIRNTIIVAKPGIYRHSVYNFKCYFIYLDISQDDKYFELMNKTPDLYINIDASKYYHLFRKLIQLSESNCDTTSDIYKAYVIELIYYLIEDSTSNINLFNKHTKFSLVDSCLSFIEENYSEKITLNDLAKKLNYSPNYIQSSFKKIMGITPLEYLEEYRLNKAKMQLILTNNKILEIALDNGFLSESYFIKRFKNKYRITPKEYRKKNLSNFLN